MATQTTEMRRTPKKKPKSLHPSLIKAQEALESKNSNPNTPAMNIKPEATDNTLKVNPVYKDGYKVKEVILDLKQWRKIPVSQEWLNGLAYEIVKWAEKEDSLIWEDFYNEYGIYKKTVEYLEEKYECIKEAKEHARMIIATRRDKMAFLMKASGSVMLGTQTYHSKSFADHKKDVASWNDKDANKTGTFNLHFHDQPEPKVDDK